MKTRIFLFIGLLMLNYSIASSNETVTKSNPSMKGSIDVFTSPDIYNLTMKWTREYCSLNPKVKINVIQSTDNNIVDVLNTSTGIGFISEESYAALHNQSNWKVVVGRDVIVPVMNASNPLLDEIYRKGITPEAFARILENPENQNWGMLLGNSQDNPIHFYITNDVSVKSAIAKFTKATQLKTDGITAVSGQEMISAIRKDLYALGFCRLVQIIDPNKQNVAENIKLVPIDKNGNGKIDYIEDIYGNLQTFSRGVWIGKYPKTLSGTIYSVSSTKPKDETEVAFLKWVLTDGQQFLSSNGYSDLVYNERQTQLEKFNDPAIYATVPINRTKTVLAVLLLIIVIIVITGIILDLVFRRLSNHKRIVANINSALISAFDEDSVIIPKGIYFDKTHTWAFMRKDGTVKIGIDDFLQHVTGNITRIEMKNAGDIIKKGNLLLTIIRKGKQLKIYSPVSGTITSQNKTLINNSSLINSSPYVDGWVYMIEPSNWLREIQFLSMGEKYKTWLKDEFPRLKDFFAAALKTTPEYAHIAFQDGGALKDNILADFDPEVWEDFQTKFLDCGR
ncbi:MAG TPA: substrate-binding domain-containing protein [Prolixibacteraceae bacterium]